MFYIIFEDKNRLIIQYKEIDMCRLDKGLCYKLFYYNINILFCTLQNKNHHL